MIAVNSLRRQRQRETLQRQLDLAHAHAELNGGIFMRNNRRMRNNNGNLLQRSSWREACG